VLARTLYDDDYLAVAFQVDDQYVRCVYNKWNEGPCRDSCVEFFVAPSADSHDKTPFFNFEVNASGAMLLFHCTRNEKGNVPLPASDGATIAIGTSLMGKKTASATATAIEPERTGQTTWQVEYHVPWALFTKWHGCDVPTAGTQWRCNFYKCADKTSHPHWGCWAPVGTQRPNFHRPSDFQQLIFDDTPIPSSTKQGGLVCGAVALTVAMAGCAAALAMRRS
jgi:hypothetical protein